GEQGDHGFAFGPHCQRRGRWRRSCGGGCCRSVGQGQLHLSRTAIGVEHEAHGHATVRRHYIVPVADMKEKTPRVVGDNGPGLLLLVEYENLSSHAVSFAVYGVFSL